MYTSHWYIPTSLIRAQIALLICVYMGPSSYDATDGNSVDFEDLPDTWQCPLCGAPKSAYTKMVTSSGEEQWVHADEEERVNRKQ